MHDPTAFYATLATASATIFGLGAAFLATRLASLGERAVVLERERGDFMNQVISAKQDEKLQLNWARRGRRNELADLYELAADLRWRINSQLLLAALLVVLCLAPLAGWPPDRPWLRTVLILVFLAAMAYWIRALHLWGGALSAKTRAAHREREQEQADLKAKGHGFLVTGDPKQIGENVAQIAATLADKVRTDPDLSWWNKHKSGYHARRLRRLARRKQPRI
jgi:hypothetical protein